MKVTTVAADRALNPAGRLARTLVASDTLMLALILCVGSLLVLPQLGKQSLWLDEGLTVEPVLTAHSVGEVVTSVLAVDTQPPASHLLFYALQSVLPPTELGLRLPSFVAIELALVLLYVVFKRLWSSPTALVVVGIAQLSPFLCFYAAEARNYGLWLLVTSASWLLFAAWMRARDDARSRRVWWLSVAWGLVNGLGLWVHLFHAFVMVGEVACAAVVLLADRKALRARRRYVVSAALAQGLAVIVFVPWLVVLALRVQEGTAGVSWTRELSVAHLAYYGFAALFGVSFGPTLRDLHVTRLAVLLAEHRVALALAAVAMVAVAACYLVEVRDRLRDRDRRWELLMLVVFPAASLAPALAYAAAADFPLHPRHLLYVWPLLPVILGLAWARGGATRLAVVGVVGLQLIALSNILFNADYAKDDQRSAIEFVDRRSQLPAYVLAEGFVGTYYARRINGRDRKFVAFEPDTREVWLVDNREWELFNQYTYKQLTEKLAELGFVYEGTYSQFRGIALRHWINSRRSSQ